MLFDSLDRSPYDHGRKFTVVPLFCFITIDSRIFEKSILLPLSHRPTVKVTKVTYSHRFGVLYFYRYYTSYYKSFIFFLGRQPSLETLTWNSNVVTKRKEHTDCNVKEKKKKKNHCVLMGSISFVSSVSVIFDCLRCKTFVS